jgi:steroid 5-alpha reductase family enzyme
MLSWRLGASGFKARSPLRSALKARSPLQTVLHRRLLSSSSAATSASKSPLVLSAAVFGGANALGFGISVATGWHYHLDLIGTGAFTAAALVTAGTESRQRLSAGLIGLWSAKLAAFLFYRVLQTHHDARLDQTLSTTKGAAGFWGSSFIWGFVCSLPHTAAAGVPLSARPPLGRALNVISVAAIVTGLGVETLADAQKWRFKAEPTNHGRFCDTGVWQISQHPNWFGNWLFWTGVLALNAPT